MPTSYLPAHAHLFSCFWPHPWHMEVPGPGTHVASHICNLCHSCGNPLCQGLNRQCQETRRIINPLSHSGNSNFFFFFWLCLCHVEPQQWQRWITNPMSHQGTPPLHIWPKILYNESSGATNSHRDAKPPKNILRHLNAEAPCKALNQFGDLGLFKDQDKESSPTVNLT